VRKRAEPLQHDDDPWGKRIRQKNIRLA